MAFGGIVWPLPERIIYGPNQLPGSDNGFEAGTDWNFGTGWTRDTTEPAATGTASARFDNSTPNKGGGTRLNRSANWPTIPDFEGRFMWGVLFQAKMSADYDGWFDFKLSNLLEKTFDDSIRAPVHLTTSWREYFVGGKNAASFERIGETTTFLVSIEPRNIGSTGSVWFDDIQIVKYGWPLQVWVPSRYRGMVKEDDDQTVTVEIDIDEEGFSDALVDLELHLELVNEATPSTVYDSQVLTSLVDGNQQATFDFSQIPFSTPVLLRNTLRQKVGQATATYANAATSTVAWPSWRLIRERSSFFDGLHSYIDYATRSPVINGRKTWLCGMYSAWIADFAPSSIPDGAKASYANLRGVRFPDSRAGAVKAFRQWREVGVNAWHDYVSMSAANPDTFIAPAIEALQDEGVAYSQHIREYYQHRGSVPGWFPGLPSSTPGTGTLTTSGTEIIDGVRRVDTVNNWITFSDPQSLKAGRHAIKVTSGTQAGTTVTLKHVVSPTLAIGETAFGALLSSPETFDIVDHAPAWDKIVNRFDNSPGFALFYGLDEPERYIDQLFFPGIYEYLVNNCTKGGIVWGVTEKETWMQDPIWRYHVDAASTDPYPELEIGSKSWRMSESCRRMTRGLKPHFQVLQLFNHVSGQNNGFPRYLHMVQEMCASLVTGAKGILWWQFMQAWGIGTYMGPGQADRKQIGSLNGSDTEYTFELSSFTDIKNIAHWRPGIERLSIETPRIFRVANLSTVFAQVQNWTPDSEGNLPITGLALNCTGGNVNIFTGTMSLSFSSPPGANSVNMEFLKNSCLQFEEWAPCNRRFMDYEDVWIQERDESLVTSVVQTPSGSQVKWTAFPHPHDPQEIVIVVCNNGSGAGFDIDVTLASAAPVGAVVEVAIRGGVLAPQTSTIALDGTRTVFSDSLVPWEGCVYIVRRDTSRVGIRTNGMPTEAALGRGIAI